MDPKVETVGTVKKITCQDCGAATLVLVFGDELLAHWTADWTTEEELLSLQDIPISCKCGRGIVSVVGTRAIVLEHPFDGSEFTVQMKTAAVTVVPGVPPTGPYQQDAIRFDLKPGTHIYQSGTPEAPVLVLRRGLSHYRAEKGEGS
ncbi:MAG: hypothetical protein WC277_02100 [Bacilli bacterium]